MFHFNSSKSGFEQAQVKQTKYAIRSLLFPYSRSPRAFKCLRVRLLGGGRRGQVGQERERSLLSVVPISAGGFISFGRVRAAPRPPRAPGLINCAPAACAAQATKRGLRSWRQETAKIVFLPSPLCAVQYTPPSMSQLQTSNP
jgi:hypothetical protein